MTNRIEYKESLSRLDKDTRICLLYLEGLIDEKFQLAMKVQQPPAPKPDFSRFESQIDSLQKQIDGLRPKVDLAYELAKNHDEQEKYLNALSKKAEKLFDEIKEHFEGLYKSGYYKEGSKIKIREEGLIE